MHLPTLAVLRAGAVLVVFAFHLHEWGIVGLGLLDEGQAAIGFFFVLSGFVLAWGYRTTTPLGRFYARRLARIYPSHLAMAVVALLVPVTAKPITGPGVVANLLLVQAWWPSLPVVFGLNGVSWYLSCELAFFVAFPFLLRWMNRHSLAALAVLTGGWYVASSVVAVLAARPGAPVWLGLLGYANPAVVFSDFLLGVLAARALVLGRRIAWPPVVATVVVCTSAIALFRHSVSPLPFVAPLCLLLVLAGARAARSGRLRCLGARPVAYASRLALAFYLVHELVIINLHAWTGMVGIGAAVLDLVVAVAAAVALHHLVELPAARAVLRAAPSSGRPRKYSVAR